MRNKLLGFTITILLGVPLIFICNYNGINLGWWAALLGFILSCAVDYFINKFIK
jgi:hypothetical protein